jgi:alpha-beta hydrolase superfamily lysophospholipase
MNSWPGGYGKGQGGRDDWKQALASYHFTTDLELIEFKGNPIDILEPIAAARIPVIHVVGDIDTVVPQAENTDVVRERYLTLGGKFTLIVKQGCDHHPHGLTDPTPVVNFIIAATAGGEAAKQAKSLAPKPDSVTTLAQGQW